jgi:hypothetical protein
MKNPGNNTRNVAALYSKTFTGAADLTTQLDSCRNSTSGGKLFVTSATPTFAYKDCAGNTVTLSTAIAGVAVGQQVDFYGVAMSEITTLTNATFLAYWHPSAAGL